MKNWHIRTVIILISLAIGVLVAIQVLWLRNAIMLREENFKSAVNKSLISVVKKMEISETLELFKNLAHETFPDLPTSKLNSNRDRGETLSADVYLELINELKINDLQPEEANPIISRIMLDTNTSHRKIFVENLVNQIISTHNKTFNERVNFDQLDSLVKIGLRDNGIKLDYNYRIVKGDRNFLKQLDELNQNINGLPENYATLMFPSDYVPEYIYLVISFKKQNKMLYESISGLMLTSLIFLLLIGFGVYMLISTIQKQKMLSEMKNDFINNMTHELKTPIATISLASEALLEKDVPISSTQRYGKMIYDENNRLKNTVETILGAAMLEKNKFKFSNEKINVHELLGIVISQNELIFEKSGAYFVTNFNADSCVIHGDEMHLANVFNNIIDNALKYSKEKLVLELSTKSNKNGIFILFKDNGIGMSQGQMKKIFEKFYRVHTGDLHNVKGFGLGLSYVKFIVESHSGYISVDSDLNKGTEFKIFLPFEHLNN